MKTNKILENRPELTNEQIIQGMDFNKIKNNASLAKSNFSKPFIIKGLIGVAVISSLILVFKNYESSNPKETQAILVDTTKIINPPVKDSKILIEPSVEEKTTPIVEHKPRTNKTITSPVTAIDTNAIASTSSNKKEIKRGTSKSYAFTEDEETENSTDLNGFITRFKPVDVKEINKSLMKITDRLFASKYEVSNILYMTFLKSLEQSNYSDLVPIAQMDTLKWTDPLSYNPPYAQYYHSHAAYNEYPAVNISHEGARLFCEWLTIQCNSDPKRKFKKVIFRLPSEEEWMLAAKGGDSSAIYPWEGKVVRNKKGGVMANFKREGGDTIGIAGKLNENADVTAPVQWYLKNNFGLYQMGGNVSEMLNEKGIAKGGSWFNGSGYLKIESAYKYDGKAQPFIGFRYFAEILEK